MIHRLLHDLQCDFRSGLRGAVVMALAIAALIAAIVLASIAAYSIIADRIGPVSAQLILAGAFLSLCLILLGLGALSQTRERKRRLAEQRAMRAARPAPPSMLANPALLATGLQIARGIGFKRLIPLIAIAGAALGYLATRSEDHTPLEGDEDEA